MADEIDSKSTEELETGRIAIIADLYHRVRFMEQNLPPRVQNLEVAVSEIREEFRGMRKEQLSAAKENHNALNAFRKTLDRHERDQCARAEKHEEAEREMGKEMKSLGKKITFASGAFWAGTVLIGFIAYHWQKIAPVIKAATEAAT